MERSGATKLEIDAREFGELVGEVRAMSQTVAEIKIAVDLLRESYITRKEYERRHSELLHDLNQHKILSDNRHEARGKRISALEAATVTLDKTDVAFGIRHKILDNVASIVFGGIITLILIVITHTFHLL